MRVLIIGCGYVGLPLGAELARSGNQVFGLRRQHSAANELERAGIDPLFADITKPEELAKLPRDFDWVVNCVASSGGGADEYHAVYLQGMRNVVDWLAPLNETARTQGTPRFVYTSSTSVYGQNDGSIVNETSPSEPSADTAHVLLEAEAFLLAAARQRNFSSMILRVGAIYGPGRGYWFKQFQSGEARVEGKGERFLNMIHLDDVIGSVIAALEHGKSGNIYNGVDDEPVTQKDFYSWLAAAMGKPEPGSTAENIELSRKRGVTNKRVSNEKLKAELDYRFKYPTFRAGYMAEIRRLRMPEPK
jgi:nucleoside-diphosphate-sugar epimerase